MWIVFGPEHHKEYGGKALPGQGGDMPGKPERSFGKPVTAHQMGQVVAAKKPDQYVFLSQNGVDKTDQNQ